MFSMGIRIGWSPALAGDALRTESSGEQGKVGASSGLDCRRRALVLELATPVAGSQWCLFLIMKAVSLGANSDTGS